MFALVGTNRHGPGFPHETEQVDEPHSTTHNLLNYTLALTPPVFRAIQPFAAINVIHFLIAGVFKITKATLQPLHAAACSTASRCFK